MGTIHVVKVNLPVTPGARAESPCLLVADCEDAFARCNGMRQ